MHRIFFIIESGRMCRQRLFLPCMHAMPLSAVVSAAVTMTRKLWLTLPVFLSHGYPIGDRTYTHRVADRFIRELWTSMTEFFQGAACESQWYGRIVDEEAHQVRLPLDRPI